MIALVRDPSHETSQSLWSLSKAEGSKLIVEKYDAVVLDSALRAVETIESKDDIHTLDVVVANSGMLSHWGHLANVQISDLESHFRINTVGQFYSSKPQWHFCGDLPPPSSSPYCP